MQSLSRLWIHFLRVNDTSYNTENITQPPHGAGGPDRVRCLVFIIHTWVHDGDSPSQAHFVPTRLARNGDKRRLKSGK
jgi:hypothetical protein